MASTSAASSSRSKAELLEERKRLMAPNVALNYSSKPLLILRGEKQYLYDENDQPYLDCVNNVAHVGHAHPHVVQAVSRQLSLLNTNSRYLHPAILDYSRRLTALMPAPLSVVFWVNSGSEANDLAMRLAQAHTKKRGVITVDGAYHGHVTSIIDISPYKYRTDGGKGAPGHVKRAIIPDVHSGLYRGSLEDEGLAERYAAHVQSLLEEFKRDEEAEAEWRAKGLAAPAPPLFDAARPNATDAELAAAAAAGGAVSVVLKSPAASSDPGSVGPSSTASAADSAADGSAATPSLLRGPGGNPFSPAAHAWAGSYLRDDGLTAGCGAFIMESILSCGGQVVPPKGYLRRVYAAVRAAGGVTIADEVQVGFGRVGEKFWAFQLQGEDVVPDIVTLGKPIGNGFPVAAVVTTAAIAASFANGMEYFNTFGGNPAAGAVANATLDVIESEGLQAHAVEVGKVLLEGFNALAERFGPGGRDVSRAPGAPCIGSVRGVGLMNGFELIRADTAAPADDRVPDPDTAGRIKYAMLEKKILLSTDGMADNVIKLKPPMCFSIENARLVLAELAEVLERFTAEANAASAAAVPAAAMLKA